MATMLVSKSGASILFLSGTWLKAETAPGDPG